MVLQSRIRRLIISPLQGWRVLCDARARSWKAKPSFLSNNGFAMFCMHGPNGSRTSLYTDEKNRVPRVQRAWGSSACCTTGPAVVRRACRASPSTPTAFRLEPIAHVRWSLGLVRRSRHFLHAVFRIGLCVPVELLDRAVWICSSRDKKMQHVCHHEKDFHPKRVRIARCLHEAALNPMRFRRSRGCNPFAVLGASMRQLNFMSVMLAMPLHTSHRGTGSTIATHASELPTKHSNSGENKNYSRGNVIPDNINTATKQVRNA